MLDRVPRRKSADWAACASWDGQESLVRFLDDLWLGSTARVDQPRPEEPSPLLFLPDGEEGCEARAARPKLAKTCPSCLSQDDLNHFNVANHAQVLLDTVAEFGLDAGWQRSAKRIPQTDSDSLSLTDVNVMVRLLEEKQLQWRVGVGMQVLDRERDLYLGYAFTTALDLCVSEQFAISAQGELGRVDSAGVRHGRAGLGLTSTHLPNLELYSGYDFFEIGSERFQEPVLGLRFKF